MLDHVVIPVRVPASIMPTVIGSPRALDSGHPLAEHACAVCSVSIGARPVVSVYVGTEPEQRRLGGAMRGVALPVHADCAGASTCDSCPACGHRAYPYPSEGTECGALLGVSVASEQRCSCHCPEHGFTGQVVEAGA
ncbi:hypothetical protein [Streptomyces sp. cg35]|uniref:hypothetical protein n=1 Tax=Streptomyces sp. cg35 TaxID=3421650 RepID=UPI003D16D123